MAAALATASGKELRDIDIALLREKLDVVREGGGIATGDI